MARQRVVTIPAIFIKMTPKKDRSWKLEIETRELAGEEVRIMADRLGQEGWWANSPNDNFEIEDIPEKKADSGLSGGKTPSQRLRNTLYILWEQTGKKGSFETYYATQMEQIIDVIKARLEKE